MLSSMWYDWEDAFNSIVSQSFDNLAVRVRQNDDGVGYEFELPGVKDEDITIEVVNGILTVTGERAGRTMTKSITLPRTLDVDKAEARYENGLLQVAFPLSETAKPRRIELSASEKHKALT